MDVHVRQTVLNDPPIYLKSAGQVRGENWGVYTCTQASLKIGHRLNTGILFGPVSKYLAGKFISYITLFLS